VGTPRFLCVLGAGALGLAACSASSKPEDAPPSDAGEDARRHDGAPGDSGHGDGARADAGHHVEAGHADTGHDEAGIIDAASGDGGPFSDCKVGGDGTYVTSPFNMLSQYCLAAIVNDAIVFAPDVVPYDLNTPLFSDYAIKTRGVWMPPGEHANYDPTLAFTFPKGAILTKSFGFADDMRKTNPIVTWVETRLLISTGESADGGSPWQAYTYIWDSAGKDATLSYSGEVRPTTWIDGDGGTVTAQYLVPSFGQCKECHSLSGVTTPIGPKARELNKTFDYPDASENELTHWGNVGILTGAPAPDAAPRLPVWNDPTTGTEAERARAYLEANCAHCHNADGFASTSGLFLLASEMDPTTYGICKPPVAAGPATGGNSYDIVPGAPDASIMTYRLASTEPGIAMPLIGRSVVDVAGLALIEGWIGSLDGGCP
jgi:uncharacterized repeat protein (TIGR03806 family)